MAQAVSDEYVFLNDVRFHFRDWEDKSAPPLVVLHGGTGHARTWDSVAEAMTPKYRVLALDQRGHGESGWAREYSTESMADDLDAFVRALRLERFELLGHSMGGMNAIVYAARRPDQLGRLVIVDIGPDFAGSGTRQMQIAAPPHDSFANVEEAIAHARAASPRADESELRHRSRNNLMLTADGRWTWRHDPVIAHTHPPGTSDDVWAMWRNISSPTLLIRGELSGILSRETAERMAHEHSNCRLVEVAGSGHSIPLDAPRGLLAGVQTFL